MILYRLWYGRMGSCTIVSVPLWLLLFGWIREAVQWKLRSQSGTSSCHLLWFCFDANSPILATVSNIVVTLLMVLSLTLLPSSLFIFFFVCGPQTVDAYSIWGMTKVRMEVDHIEKFLQKKVLVLFAFLYTMLMCVVILWQVVWYGKP